MIGLPPNLDTEVKMTGLIAIQNTEYRKILFQSKESVEAFRIGDCDVHGIIAATACGALGGIVDIFLVGAPSDGKPLTKWSDQQIDNAVMSFAKITGWNPREGKERNIASAIGHLEKTFPVHYDQRHSGDIYGAFKMSAKNHHFKSLSHSPDPIGLFFSLLDQFLDTSTFVDQGKIKPISISNCRTGDGAIELRGNTFEAKLFCGCVNWLGHVMSDIAGSSGTRGKDYRRGAGIAAPFYELLQFCNFGKFSVEKDKQDLATIATRVYQEGYDARFALALAVPVVLVDLLTKLIWAIRQYFQFGKPIAECLPTKTNDSLRTMLLISNGTLCIMDGADALIRSGAGANSVELLSRMNYIAWLRLAMLVVRELTIRLGLQRDIEAMTEINRAYRSYLEDLERIDTKRFTEESEAYERFAKQLNSASSPEEFNGILLSTYEELGISKPWDGSLDKHMSDPNATLHFE
jgi:hypothetical protein